MPDLSNPIIEWFTTYRYFVILPLTVVQGPPVMLLAGFLLRLEYFSFFPLYFVLMAGDLIGDVMWYAVGHFAARPFFEKHGRFLSVSREMIMKLERLFHNHQNKILFISKITMGFGFALVTLVSAGVARVPFRKYMLLNTLGGFIWTALLVSVGYFFGNLYLVVDEGFRLAFIVLIVAIIGGVAYGASRALRKHFLQNGK